MNREETKAAIEVMQHYADGGEVESTSTPGLLKEPTWDWLSGKYRIKKRSGECWAELSPDSGVVGDQGGLVVFLRQEAHSSDRRFKIRWEEV